MQKSRINLISVTNSILRCHKIYSLKKMIDTVICTRQACTGGKSLSEKSNIADSPEPSLLALMTHKLPFQIKVLLERLRLCDYAVASAFAASISAGKADQRNQVAHTRYSLSCSHIWHSNSYLCKHEILVLITLSSDKGSDEHVQIYRLARAFAAHIGGTQITST